MFVLSLQSAPNFTQKPSSNYRKHVLVHEPLTQYTLLLLLLLFIGGSTWMHSSTLHAHPGNNGRHFRTNTLLTSAGGKRPWGRKQRYGQVRTCHRAYSNNSLCPNRSCGLILSSRLLLLPTVQFLYLSLRLRRSLSLCLSERTWVDANSRKPLYDWVVVMYDQRTLTTCTRKYFTGITLVAPQLPANGQCSWRWPLLLLLLLLKLRLPISKPGSILFSIFCYCLRIQRGWLQLAKLYEALCVDSAKRLWSGRSPNCCCSSWITSAWLLFATKFADDVYFLPPSADRETNKQSTLMAAWMNKIIAIVANLGFVKPLRLLFLADRCPYNEASKWEPNELETRRPDG